MNNDLISRKALIKAMPIQFYTLPYFKHIIDIIDYAPTVETYTKDDMTKEYLKGYNACKDIIQPTGEWKFCEGVTTQGYLKCSNCEWLDFRKAHFNYCPNCGAKMKGEEE